MTEAGYTATEALAALAIIGLAIGGLTSGMQVIGRVQSTTTANLRLADAARTTSRKLNQLLAQAGPFRSDKPGAFVGEPQAFDFPCGIRRCGARIQGDAIVISRSHGADETVSLPSGSQPDFRYIGGASSGGTWPAPRPPAAAAQWDVLQSVALVASRAGRGDVVAVAHLWSQQAPDCEFDAIAQDCRAVSQ